MFGFIRSIGNTENPRRKNSVAVSAQVFDVGAVFFSEAHFCQVGYVGFGRLSCEDQSIDAPGGQSGIQIGSNGAVAVGGGGIVEQYLQGALSAAGPQQNSRRIPVMANNIGQVRCGICGEIREIGLNVLPVVIQQVAQKALALCALHQVVALVLLGQFNQIVDIDADQADIHQCGRIGVDNDSIGRENSAADGIDDPQFDYGRHQHGSYHQSGPKIADHLDHGLNPPCVICLSGAVFGPESRKFSMILLLYHKFADSSTLQQTRCISASGHAKSSGLVKPLS